MRVTKPLRCPPGAPEGAEFGSGPATSLQWHRGERLHPSRRPGTRPHGGRDRQGAQPPTGRGPLPGRPGPCGPYRDGRCWTGGRGARRGAGGRGHGGQTHLDPHPTLSSAASRHSGGHRPHRGWGGGGGGHRGGLRPDRGRDGGADGLRGGRADRGPRPPAHRSPSRWSTTYASGRSPAGARVPGAAAATDPRRRTPPIPPRADPPGPCLPGWGHRAHDPCHAPCSVPAGCASASRAMGSSVGISWNRRDGHQFRRPHSTAADGTSRVRTTNVSSRMPSARPVPIWRIWPEVATASTPKVPASTRPAEVTVVPVLPMAEATAGRSRQTPGLLADPAHDQDVVVLAEGHDEDEQEERQGEVDPQLVAERPRR